jgi:pimeloyl-ACP methyl ester carboxylesterase
VVILPGLGNAAEDYVPLEQALRQELGATVTTALVSRPDWLRNAAGVVDSAYWAGTLNPVPTVNWYLERISAAVDSALRESGQERVSLVAHSAGGWLARVWLQQSPQNASRVSLLLSLGSPLRPPPTNVPGVIDQTRGILTHVDANCASAEELAASGTRVVCVAGRYILGSDEVFAARGAWVVGQGYRQVCGRSDVWGDGITPTEWALLPGAEHVTLEDVFHSPVGSGPDRRWYGSAGVLEQWVQYLRSTAPSAAQAAMS